MFFKIGVLKYFALFTFCNKFAVLKGCNFIKKNSDVSLWILRNFCKHFYEQKSGIDQLRIDQQKSGIDQLCIDQQKSGIDQLCIDQQKWRVSRTNYRKFEVSKLYNCPLLSTLFE